MMIMMMMVMMMMIILMMTIILMMMMMIMMIMMKMMIIIIILFLYSADSICSQALYTSININIYNMNISKIKAHNIYITYICISINKSKR